MKINPKILFIVGTMNQLTMQHKVANALGDNYDCWFTPYYHIRSPLFWSAEKLGILKHTFGDQIQRTLYSYIKEQSLQLDYRGEYNSYDLVVMGIDQFIPKNIAGKRQRKLLIQEGLIWPEGWRYRLAKLPFFPRFFANSNAMGLSLDYEYFCVASDGYLEWFAQNGIPRNLMRVTGIPNFDQIKKDADQSQFEHNNHLLFATHCLREDLERENRRFLLNKARKLAGGRQIIVKLHPRENFKKRSDEVEHWLPEALVFQHGNTRAMISRCDIFMTTFSSTIFDALVLKKTIGHCELDIERVKSLLPIQHGRAAINIAQVIRDII